MQIRPIAPGDVDKCEALLENLPEWFGIAQANRAYIEGLSELPSVVAIENDTIIGFASIRDHGAGSAEIDIMAVARDSHRHGVGTQLLRWILRWCQENEFQWLHVKTRGPSTPDPNYEKTREFWEGVGFSRLFESLTHWGPSDAALILVMQVPPAA